MDRERTGLLAQALRCLTAPVQYGSITKYIHEEFWTRLKRTRIFSKRRLLTTKKTGDMLGELSLRKGRLEKNGGIQIMCV